ncbi:hypothetical protein [Bartonella tamiae]|uniref:Glycosyl transferase family 1 domain-containing protein n=1 Tax=Bartonella tamiae Th239 TaxID=1094558 RepID=J0ZKY3_9HYPH|nr:hypothetical protein [Bartonella tamiae]EJF89033.1 hypothetical protein ME5_01584 [Bartonella tamiae Th239]EJF94717.1 hypothetical protein MEG_00298 [Bartonella tamiae Th307]
MLDKAVDLFVTTFPICSALTEVKMMSSGIPILNHYVINPSIYPTADFCDPNQFLWYDKDDLLAIISTLNADILTQKSKSAKAWFLSHNDYQLYISSLLNSLKKSYPVNKKP